MTEPAERLQWRKSGKCGSNACAEVATRGDRVFLRDSKHPETSPLAFTAQEWRSFVKGVAEGEFDFG